MMGVMHWALMGLAVVVISAAVVVVAIRKPTRPAPQPCDSTPDCSEECEDTVDIITNGEWVVPIANHKCQCVCRDGGT